MEPAQRLFTHAEATALMPAVRELLREAQEHHRRVTERQRAYAELTPAMRANGHALKAMTIQRALGEALDALRDALRAITDLGVEVKDIERGLVDFPSLRDGRVVYLCWLTSEPAIGYWHELDTGFAGRQPL